VVWVLIGAVVVGLVAVVPRRRKWGPITYRRQSFVGGPVSGRLLSRTLFVALVVLVAIAVTS
jgi:hypothetical protein